MTDLIKCSLTDGIVLNTEECPRLFHAAEYLSQRHVGRRQLVMQHVLMMFTQL